MLPYREALKATLRKSLTTSGQIAQVRADNTPAMDALAEAMEAKNAHVLRLLSEMDAERGEELAARRVGA